MWTNSYQMFHLASYNSSQYRFEDWYIPEIIQIAVFLVQHGDTSLHKSIAYM